MSMPYIGLHYKRFLLCRNLWLERSRLLFVSMPYIGLHYYSVYHTFTSYPNTFSTIINLFIEKSGSTVFINYLKKCLFMRLFAFLVPIGLLIGRLTHFLIIYFQVADYRDIAELSPVFNISCNCSTSGYSPHVYLNGLYFSPFCTICNTFFISLRINVS